MFYNARWYDPYLNRWAQPDTIVLQASQGVQAWDRYAYANNNPVRYTDPSGHDICDEDGNCFNQQTRTHTSRGLITRIPPPRPRSSVTSSKTQTPTHETTSTQSPIAETFSSLAYLADETSFVLNYAEVYWVDGIMVLSTGSGCLAGPEGCAAGALTGIEYDILFSWTSPLGVAENILGGFSLGATAISDGIQGNTSFSLEDGLFVGKDTLVSFRNFTLGLIPEANIDYLVGQAQFGYDIERNEGRLTGGAVKITWSDVKEILRTFFWGR